MLAVMILSSDITREGSFKSIGRVGMFSGRPNSNDDDDDDVDADIDDDEYHVDK